MINIIYNKVISKKKKKLLENTPNQPTKFREKKLC